MKPAFAHFHRHHMHSTHDHGEAIGRRQALKLGAAGAAAAVAAATVGSQPAEAKPNQGGPTEYGPIDGAYSNEMFDVDAVLGGAWDVSPYGTGDQRGTSSGALGAAAGMARHPTVGHPSVLATGGSHR